MPRAISVEMNMGQMVEDVRLLSTDVRQSSSSDARVASFPTPAEVLDAIVAFNQKVGE